MEIRLIHIKKVDAMDALSVAWEYVEQYLPARKAGREIVLGGKFRVKHTESGNVWVEYKRA